MNCTGSVARTIKWLGSVGLIYPSDYEYASVNESCEEDIFRLNSTCETSNWLQTHVDYFWTIIPVDYAGVSNTVYALNSVGNGAYYRACTVSPSP